MLAAQPLSNVLPAALLLLLLLLVVELLLLRPVLAPIVRVLCITAG
jgi:hypothetical protein